MYLLFVILDATGGGTLSKVCLLRFLLVVVLFSVIFEAGAGAAGKTGDCEMEEEVVIGGNLDPEITLTSSALIVNISTKLRISQVLDGVIYIRPL